MKTKWLLCMAGLLLSLCCRSQENRLLTVDTELSSSMINDIYQDKEGFIWIATEDGLNSYDGVRFTTYRHQMNDNTSLSSNYVRRLYENGRGEFLVCSLNGVQLYDRGRGIFRNIPLILTGGDTLASANFSSIVESRDGRMILGSSGHGLFTLREAENGQPVLVQNDVQVSYLVDNLFEDSKGNLWVVTGDVGICCLARDGRRIIYGKEAGIEWPSVVCEDKRGNIYAGCMTNGLFRYDERTGKFKHIHSPGNANMAVKNLYVVDENRILIGTDGNGMKEYDTRTGQIEDSQIGTTSFDFKRAKVHSIMVDNQGNTWLGLFQKGVLILPAVTNGFHYIGYKSSRYNVIGSCCVMSLCVGHDGTIWVGTDNDGLYGVGPDGQLRRRFTPKVGDEHAISPTIMSLCETSTHQLYAGSYRDGLWRVDVRTGRCTRIPLYDKKGEPVRSVYGLVEDADQRLWIATMGTGLFCLDLRKDKVRRLPSSSNGIDFSITDNTLFNSWINCLLLTRGRKLYIGTYDGLACLDIPTLDFVSSFKVNSLCVGEIVFALYEDADGLIWVGTSYGLHSLNPDTGEKTTYTTTDGLPNNVICSIKGDENGNLWIGTSSGLSCYRKDSKSFINFYAADGLQGNEFVRGAVFADRDGTLLFGGTGGITMFHPDEIIAKRAKPQVRLTGFYLHDRPVRMGMKSGKCDIIDKPVGDAEKFNLAYTDNAFSIEFSAMEFYNPGRVSYQYAFGNNHWTSLTPGVNRVMFSNLSPGDYTFRVRAEDYNTYSDVKEITIRIAPPWYATWWAKLFYVILACGVVLAILREVRHRYLARQEMLEHIHAEEMNEAKLQFFINISHEIRTPMSLVISPLQELMSMDVNPERQRIYQLIYRNAERILRLINQLMDIRKIDKGQMRMSLRKADLVDFLRDLYVTFEEQAKLKHIDFEFQTNVQNLDVWIDPDHFDKVVLNILSNAFKYTDDGGSIILSLTAGEDETAGDSPLRHYAEIKVEDSGIGLDETTLEHLFDRFYQARNAKNMSGSGTGVGLHLTRSLVELHHGTICARNNDGRSGCSFIVRIPLGNAHLRPDEMVADSEAAKVKKSAFITEAWQTESQAEEKEGTEERLGKKYTVFVVEDDEEIRKYVSYELGKDFRIVEFSNGKDALTGVLKQIPDLVISDIMMPGMDGRTLCRKIKQNITVNHVPVVLLTALSSEEDNIEGLQVGADAYIMKPFSVEVLRNTAFNLIRIRELLKNNYSGKQEQTERIAKMQVSTPDEMLMDRIMQCINKNLSNPKLTADMLADTVGISRTHLYRKLKEQTNQSPRDFIRNVRLKQAAELLTGSKLSVNDVSILTGFSSSSYFSTAFKDLYGVTPTDFKEKAENAPDGKEPDLETAEKTDESTAAETTEYVKHLHNLINTDRS